MTANATVTTTDSVPAIQLDNNHNNEVDDNVGNDNNGTGIIMKETKMACHGLQIQDDFISQEEASELLEYLSYSLKKDGEWQQIGFQRRRRVLNIRSLENLPPSMMRSHNKEGCQNLWRNIRKRIKQLLMLQGQKNDDNDDDTDIQMTVEERYTLSQSCTGSRTKKDLNDTLAGVSMFESSQEHKRQWEKNETKNISFVAYMALQNPCVQILTVPKSQNQVHDYHVQSSWTLYQKPQTLIIKQHDSLWSCKYRIGDYHPLQSEQQQQQQSSLLLSSSKKQTQMQRQIFLLKISNLTENNDDDSSLSPINYNNPDKSHKNSINDDDNIIINQAKLQQKRQNELTSTTIIQDEINTKEKSLLPPPLSQLITIVVTTSPIKSNPSTDVLEGCFATFPLAGKDFAYECQKVIVCDGCRISSNTSSRKHANAKQALRNGLATETQAKNYQQYKLALKQLCLDAKKVTSSQNNNNNNNKSPFLHTKVVELSERHGYGFALRHALLYEVHTPYVCVIQHDRTFMRPTPIREVVYTMYQQSNVIKYIGMNMRSNLLYRDAFVSKYGKIAFDQLLQMIRYPSLLRFDAKLYGPNAKLDTILQNTPILNRNDDKSQKVKKNLLSLQQNYRKSRQNLTHNPPPLSDKSLTQCSLTPTLFWYDNIHVCETSHYRDFIFCDKYKMVARGGFVEDKTSPVITKNVERLGLQKGHSKFGCYLLDDHSGMFFTGHLDGGSYLTRQGRQKQKLQNMQISNSKETSQ